MNRLACLLSNFAFIGMAFAGPLDGWRWLYPQPSGASLYGLTYGGGQFIAVGEGTTIARSTNGVNWTLARDVSGSSRLNAIAWGNGLFVAVGQQGLVMTSLDGTDWSSHQPFVKDLNSVAFGAGRFVAVSGDSSTNWIQTSVDGVTWSVIANLPPTQFGNNWPLVDVTYGERFVAIASKYTILLSTDGLNWVRTTNTPPSYYELAGVTYGNGRYVAAGPYTILYSTHATNWQQSPSFIGHYHSDVAYGSERFVIVGNTGIAGYSSNAVNWTGLPFSTFGDLTDTVYADGRFVAVGYSGLIVSSTNGTNWSFGTGPRFSYAIACDTEGCVVIDYDNSLRATTNFTDWTIVATNQWSALDYIGNRFIMPADGGVIDVGTGLYNWTSIATPTTNRLNNGAFGHGRYVVSGDKGTLVISSNAIDWAVISLGVTNNLGNIAFGNGRFITQEYRWGDVAISTNGLEWTFHPAVPNAERASLLVFGNGVFVSLGSTGTIARTTDGLTWSRAQIRTNASLGDLTFAHGLFLIGGSQNGQTFLLASRDGTNWSYHPLPHLGFVGVLAGYRDTVIVGEPGRFLQSELFPSLAMRRGPPFQLSLAGAAGTYQIEVSENIEGPWQVITNLTAPSQWTLETSNSTKRFYRALSP